MTNRLILARHLRAEPQRFVSGFFGVLLMTLAGCSPDVTPTDVSVVPANPEVAVDSVVVNEQPATRVTVGSQGGTLRLTDDIGAVYSIAYRDGGAWLEGVVLLRGSKRGWYNDNADKAPVNIQNFGVGGSIGPHMVVVTPNADGIWVDDKLYVALQGNNVALFEGAGAQLMQAGLASLDAYLGPAPLEDAGKRRTLVQQRLRALLAESKSIAALWSGR